MPCMCTMFFSYSTSFPRIHLVLECCFYVFLSIGYVEANVVFAVL